MPYIESIFLYLIVTSIAFVFIVIIILPFVWVLSKFPNVAQKKNFIKLFNYKFKLQNILNIIKRKGIKLDNDWEEYYYTYPVKDVLKSNAVAFFTIFYFLAFSFAYINQTFDNFNENSAYPKAKAYTIVGKTISSFHITLLNTRLVRPEDSIDNIFMGMQDYILEKIYKYIPENDVEREYWLFQFKYMYIVKLRYAPIKEEFKKDFSYTRLFYKMELGTADFDPKLLTIMDTLHNISKKLMNEDMKDKELNKGKKYLPIAQMSHYLLTKMVFFKSLKNMQPTKRYKLFFKDKKLVKKYFDYIDFLILLDKKRKKDKNIEKAFYKSPFSQALLYYSILDGIDGKLNFDTLFNNIYPCSSPKLKLFMQYHKEFYNWTKLGNSSFQKLSGREQKNVNTLYRFSGGASSYYTIAKYICKYKFDYEVFDEIQQRNNKSEGFSMYWFMVEFSFNKEMLKKIKELEKQENKGENR